MSPRVLQAFLFVGLIVLRPAAGVARADDRLQELLDRSPFGSRETAAETNPAAEQPLEFRGVLEERGKQIFSIYQTASHRSMWVDLKQQTDNLRIESYDDAQECISVVYQGKALRLPLTGGSRKFKAPQSVPPKIPKPEATNEYHDRPFRIGHVFEENMIRQAVRQPATTPAEPTALTATPDKH